MNSDYSKKSFLENVPFLFRVGSLKEAQSRLQAHPWTLLLCVNEQGGPWLESG